MEYFVAAIMLAALYLLYRTAYPKHPVQLDSGISEQKSKTVQNVMGKSRFVLPDRSKPLQTPATTINGDTDTGKPVTFAPETEENMSGVISPDRLDEVFDATPDPEDLDVEPDETETGYEAEIDPEAEEEAEDRIQGQGEMLAAGLDYDDLYDVAKVVSRQPETVSEKTAATMTALEHTDMFEMLASGDRGKMDWIKSVIDRHVQAGMPEERDSENEAESDTSGADYGNFNIADFLNKS